MEPYCNCGVLDYSENNILREDGTYFNDVNSTWRGISAFSALAFGEVLTFELQVNGETVQTLTYSVNSYAYSKYDEGNAMSNLALALYRYGVSAVAYVENN